MPGIFLRDADQYVELHEQPYDAERTLQDLIAQHPQVVAGSEDQHGTLVLVKQEAAVVDPELGGSRWSLDHLYLDRSGVPTLVEVKRASDPRSRREVVAQMLEYAANASASWTAEGLREWFDETCRNADREPDRYLQDALGVEDVEEYWGRVGANLGSEQLRLVFVADSIGSELRRMIEYLNRQMQDTDVFAIEVMQYVTQDGAQQTIVPRIIGLTEAARQGKRHARRSPWDRESVFARLAELDPAHQRVAEALFAWAGERRDLRLEFGNGTRDGSFRWGSDAPYLWPFAVYTYGSVEINFQPMSRRAPFDDPELLDAFHQRLLKIPGVQFASSSRPSFPLALLHEPGALAQFTEALDWAFDQAGALVPAWRP